MTANKVYVLVNLIRYHKYIGILGQHLTYRLKLFLAVNGTCRIWRGANHHCLCLGSDCSLNLSGGNLEILFNASLDYYGNTTGKLNHFGITYPAGWRQKNLVTGIDDSHNNIAERLLCAGRYHNLGRSVIKVVLALKFICTSFAQPHITRNGRILGVVLFNSLNCSLLNVIGSIKVRFTYTHVYYIDTLCRKFVTLLHHGKSCRCCESVDSIWNLCHYYWCLLFSISQLNKRISSS